jgi:hypothetical protein
MQSALVYMRVGIEMIDTLGIKGRRAPFHAMDDIVSLHQEFRQIGAILTGNPCDQRCLGHDPTLSTPSSLKMGTQDIVPTPLEHHFEETQK